MHPRQRLRLSTLPQLYEFGRKPSLAPTTMAEVSDQDIGLKPDPLAQEMAERYVRAAVAYRLKQAEKAEITQAARRAKIVIAAAELEISDEIAEGITDKLVRMEARAQGPSNRTSCRSQSPG